MITQIINYIFIQRYFCFAWFRLINEIKVTKKKKKKKNVGINPRSRMTMNEMIYLLVAEIRLPYVLYTHDYFNRIVFSSTVTNSQSYWLYTTYWLIDLHTLQAFPFHLGFFFSIFELTSYARHILNNKQ